VADDRDPAVVDWLAAIAEVQARQLAPADPGGDDDRAEARRVDRDLSPGDSDYYADRYADQHERGTE
jgi:hypothetical protein